MSLTRASLRYYIGRHLLTVMAVTAFTAVVAGALLAAASARTSLRDLALQRIGAADVAVSSTTAYSQRLGAGMAIAAPNVVHRTVSLIALEGAVTRTGPTAAAARVQVYGVDDAFWTFHGVAAPALEERDVLLSPGLAAELDASTGTALTLHVRGPSDIPLGLVQGRRDDGGVAVDVTMAGTRDTARMGEFSLTIHQAPARAVFVPLRLLQHELRLTGRVNTTLVQYTRRDDDPDAPPPPVEAIQRAWMAAATLPDHGLRIRRVPGDRVMALDGLGGVIAPDVSTRVQAALARTGRPGVPALTTLIRSIRIGTRAVPYSTVSAMDVDGYMRLSVPMGPPAPGTDEMSDGDPLVLGSIEVRVGRGGVRVGRVQVAEAERRTSGTGRGDRGPARDVEEGVPTSGPLWLNEWAADDLDARIGDTVHLEYFAWTDDGRLETRTASFELRGIHPMMRAGGDRSLTPDIPGLTDATSLSQWRVPFPVDVTRIRPEDEAYWSRWRTAPKAFVPLETGQELWGTRFGNVSSIRFALGDAEAVAAAVRADTNTQLVVRPLRAEALAASTGVTAPLRLSLVASALVALPLLFLAGLVVATNTRRRADEVSLLSTVGFGTRQIRQRFFHEHAVSATVGLMAGMALAVAYAAFLLHALRTWWVDATGTTTLTLHALPLPLLAGIVISAAAVWLAVRRGTHTAVDAAVTPGLHVPTPPHPVEPRRFAAVARALLVTGIILLAGTQTFRRDGAHEPMEPTAATGGFSLMAETSVPLMHDPGTPEGRTALRLDDAVMNGVRVTRLRLRAGDEASRLTLYRPQNPRIAGVVPAHMAGRFLFASVLPAQDGSAVDTSASPWQLLDEVYDDGAVPAIADAATLSQVFGVSPGGTFTFLPDGDTPVTLRFVATLADSVLQSGIIIGEQAFVRLFPREEGHRLWLIEAPDADAAGVAAHLSERLAAAGVEVTDTRARLAAYDRVGNTRLTVFQTFGAAGLLLGFAVMAGARRMR